MRFRGCCCFSLRTGCTILGMVQVIGSLFALWGFAMILSNDVDNEFKRTYIENLVFSIPYNMTYTTVALLCILYMSFIPVSLIMVHGNVTNKKHLMTPFVWLYLFKICVICVGYFSRLVLNFMLGYPSKGFDALWRLILGGFVSFLVVQAVRSRMMEIQGEKRRKIFSTEVQQNLLPPPYEEKPKLSPV